VWSFLSGQKLRVFQSEKPEIWTSFEYSFDETYLAGIIENNPIDDSPKENILCIFCPSDMKIVPDESANNIRRPIQISNAQKIKWANNSQKIVVVCFAFGDEKSNKSEVSVIELPSRKKYKWARFTIDFVDAGINWAKDDKYIL